MSFVFVSHAGPDKLDRVKPLVQALAIEGVRLWLDRPGSGPDGFQLPRKFVSRYGVQSLRPGRPWDAGIASALREAGAVLICLSRAVLDPEREVLQQEMLVAQHTQKAVTCIVDDLNLADVPGERGLLALGKAQALRVDTKVLARALAWLSEEPTRTPDRLPQAWQDAWEVVRSLRDELHKTRDELQSRSRTSSSESSSDQPVKDAPGGRRRHARRISEVTSRSGGPVAGQARMPPERPRATVSFHSAPRAPALSARPEYLPGNKQFVGRSEQFACLDEWAGKQDSQPLLFFEAMGGTGKSYLAWRWLVDRSADVRADWAGRFWYSFYEDGANTTDFLTRALVYMTGTPRKQLERVPHEDLSETFIDHLAARPWLIVMDGVERLLVRYQGIDRALDADGDPEDKGIGSRRDGREMMRADDDRLFRRLLRASASKVLMTSRDMPRCLTDLTGQVFEEIQHHMLPGLSDEQAEQLIRSFKIRGKGSAMRAYLRDSCDCHPLAIGFIAGLVVHHLPAPHDFDHWLTDELGGRALHFASVEFSSRRSHILEFALAALMPPSRTVLSILAAMSVSVSYDTLRDMLLRKAAAVGASSQPAGTAEFDVLQPATVKNALDDLCARGLVMFNSHARMFDVHPVVRRVVRQQMNLSERKRIGGQIVGHSRRQHAHPWQEARTLEDLKNPITAVEAQLFMESYGAAWAEYNHGLHLALLHNLEEAERCLALMRPLFVGNWAEVRQEIATSEHALVFHTAAVTHGVAGYDAECIELHLRTLELDVKTADWVYVAGDLLNLGKAFGRLSRLKLATRLIELSSELATIMTNDEMWFRAQLALVEVERRRGLIDKALARWSAIDGFGRDWDISRYRQGEAELERLRCLVALSTTTAQEIEAVEAIVTQSPSSRKQRRLLHRLRGDLSLDQADYRGAMSHFKHAVDMARSAGLRDSHSETSRIRAEYLGGILDFATALTEARRLANDDQRDHLALAKLFGALHQHEQARAHARTALARAQADGESWEDVRVATEARSVLAGATDSSAPVQHPQAGTLGASHA